MTVSEAAAAANVCTKTIYRAIEHQRLEATRPGDGVSIRIHPAWLDEWMEIGRTLRKPHLRAVPDQTYPEGRPKGQPRRGYLEK